MTTGRHVVLSLCWSRRYRPSVRAGNAGQFLPLLQRVVADLDAPLATLIGIANAIPYPSLSLAEADLAITRRILAELPFDAPGKRATWPVTLAIHLGQVGHLAEALPQPRRPSACTRS